MNKVDESQVLDVNDPRTRVADPHHLLVNLTTGNIKEIPCGPIRAGHMGGDRPLVWDKHLKRPVIPKRWAGKFMFLETFCTDGKRCGDHKIKVSDGRRFYEDYVKFVAARGRGSKMRRDGTKPELHPAIVELEAANPNRVYLPSKADKETKRERKLEAELVALREEFRQLAAAVQAKA